MAGGKGKGKQTRRHKFEKLDLAALDSIPYIPLSSSKNVWGQVPPTSSHVNTLEPQTPTRADKDTEALPGLDSSPSAMSTTSDRFDNWNRLNGVWEGPGTLSGQNTFAPVHFPYYTIIPEVARWYEGEVYTGEWEPAPFCKIDTDWTKPEIKNGFIKRTDDRGKPRVHLFPVRWGQPGEKSKPRNSTYSQTPGRPATQEPWDYAVLYKKSDEQVPAPAANTEASQTTQGKPTWHQTQREKKKKPAKGKGSKKKSRLGLDDFSDEILECILRFSLQHHEPIPVDLFWQRQHLDQPPPLDYRLMHASKRLYRIGIELYYKLNTFIVDMTPMVCREKEYLTRPADAPAVPLGMFQTIPKNPEKIQWTTIMNLHIARECVRRVIIVNRKHRWEAACTFLRGFDILEEVTFDLRGTGLVSDHGWETIEIDEAIRGSLIKANIHVPASKLRAGHTCEGRAKAEMERQLALDLVLGGEKYLTSDKE